MRAKRLLASVVAVVAFSAIAAAQAAASPEFHAEKYPVKVEGSATNFQGFEGTGVASNCEAATAKTEEEGALNPTKDSKKLEVHPKYEKCILTLLGATSGAANVVTTGCNYVFNAAKPNEPTGTVDIKCATGKEIKIEATFLPGCVITVGPQTALAKIEYRNEPAGKVEVRAEVSNIKTKIAEACGTGKLETTSKYREGEVTGGNAKLAPEGHPAKFVSEGKSGVEADPIEVALNEAHWYENHVGLGAQSGLPGEEGEPTLMWGKVTLSSVGTGAVECLTEWGGHVYNPQGVGGQAVPGETKIAAFHAYDCTAAECEATLKSKLEITPEGLGIIVTAGVAKEGAWEGKLGIGAPVRLKIGNKTAGSATAIKWHLNCPKTTGGEYVKTWSGELAPEIENGTAIGSAPSKLTFNSGELEVGAGPEKGTAAGKVKLMGYEGGEIVSIKNP
jgi:hypothetical protein